MNSTGLLAKVLAMRSYIISGYTEMMLTVDG